MVPSCAKYMRCALRRQFPPQARFRAFHNTSGTAKDSKLLTPIPDNVVAAREAIEKLSPDEIMSLGRCMDTESRRRLFVVGAELDLELKADIAKIDENHDGKISRQELLTWMRHDVRGAIERSQLKADRETPLEVCNVHDHRPTICDWSMHHRFRRGSRQSSLHVSDEGFKSHTPLPILAPRPTLSWGSWRK